MLNTVYNKAKLSYNLFGMKKKKIVITLLIALFVCIAFLAFGCTEANSVPGDLFIEAADVTNVPVGEYAIEYRINNYEKYKDKYSLRITVNVYDDSLTKIDVKNARSFMVESDKEYSVSVLVSGVNNGENFIITKQFYVYAAHADRVISFLLPNEIIIEKKYVKYGESLNVEDFPEIPDYYDNMDVTGDDFADITDEELKKIVEKLLKENAEKWGSMELPAILSRKWIYYSADGKEVEVTSDAVANITESFNIYSSYEYETDLTPHTMKFETNGGTPVSDINGDSTTVISFPTEKTEKEGYTFMWWCLDKELLYPFDWTRESVLYKDVTLYAKWVKDNTDKSTHNKYFDFTFYENEDYFGYSFYTIKAKDAAALSKDLILPNTYDDGKNGKYPVRGMEIDAFKGARITSLYIPNTYDMGTQSAFSGCTQLETVTFEEGSELLLLESDMFFQCQSLISIDIPDSIEYISSGCFSGCSRLEEVKLPEKLYFIEEYAFFECVTLTEIDIPDSTEIIGDQAFAGCHDLEFVNFTENGCLNSVGEDVFFNTSIFKLVLPYTMKNVTLIEQRTIEVTYYEKPQEETNE